MRTPISALTFGLCFAAFCGEAFAQSACESDSDCAAGMVCEVVGVSGCGAPACAPDDPDCDSKPMCESEEFRACVPGPCETDADCGEDQVCQVSEWEACGGAAMTCDSNGDCEVVESDCESGTSSECVYKWNLPCESDADCGEKFECVTGPEQCDCAASGGSADPARPATDLGAVDGGAAPPPPEADLVAPDCTCSTYSYCQAEELPCESADECPSGWSCEAPVMSTCGGPAIGDDGRESGIAAPPVRGMEPADVDGGAPDVGFAPPQDGDPRPDEPKPDEPMCEVVELPKLCVPPGGTLGGGRPGVDLPTSGEAEDNSGEPPVAPGKGSEVDVDDPAVGEDGNGGDEEGELGDDDIVLDEEPGDDEPATEDDEPKGGHSDAGADDVAANEEDTDSGSSGDSGLCSLGTPGHSAAPAAWLVALLGLAMMRRRRS